MKKNHPLKMINAGRYKTCHSDIINYGNLPHTDFIRTQTLCQGGDLCDFYFVRHAKGEQWERMKSI